MEVSYRNLMLDALPALSVKLHSDITVDGSNDVIAGAVITDVVFAAAASGQRQVTYNATVPDGTTVAMASFWDGATLVTIGDPPDRSAGAADTLRGSLTIVLP